MSMPTQIPPEAQILQYMTGYQISQVTYTLTKLNIPDQLKAGPKSCHTLAKELQLQENELFRLLRAATALGLLSFNTDKQTYELTELSTILTEDHSRSLKSFSLMFGEESYFAWGNIVKSVQNGKSAFSQLYGKPHFDYLETNKEACELFDKAMTNFTNNFKDTFLQTLEIDDKLVKCVVDIGGGEGKLVSFILDKYPNLTGVVFDLPQVVERKVKRHERLSTKAGSFFNEKDIPEGDLYLLKHILHDWGDLYCITILNNIKQAMLKRKEEGVRKIVVIEHLIPEKIKAGDMISISNTLMDINMMAMCEGGKERTESEFKTLFEKGGFKLTKIIPTNCQLVIIEGELI